MIFIFKRQFMTRYEKRWKVLILSVTESAALRFSVVLKGCDIDMVKNFADRIARMADSINRGELNFYNIQFTKFNAEKDRNFLYDNGTYRRNDVYQKLSVCITKQNLKKTRRINKITSDKSYLFRLFYCGTLLFLIII